MTPPTVSFERLRELLFDAGACAVGVAPCEPVPESDNSIYDNWIAAGRHGCLGYMTNYPEVRRDPRELLPGARSIIMAAFRYLSPEELNYQPGHIRWARYAVGDDYHDVIRSRLKGVTERLMKEVEDQSDQSDQSDRSDLSDSSEVEGGKSSVEVGFRVAVDTAPLRERYHAWRAGLGYFGLNGQLIVPGIGSSVLLGAIITTLELPSSEPLTALEDNAAAAGISSQTGRTGLTGQTGPTSPTGQTSQTARISSPGVGCLRCGRCVKACPGQALDGRGGVDARRCLSCLTIENRDPELHAEMLDYLRATGSVYGCDVCQEVCPLSSPENFNNNTASAEKKDNAPTEKADNYLTDNNNHYANITPTANINPHAGVLPEFMPRPVLLDLRPEDIRSMDQPTFSAVFARSAIKRAKLAGLRRNCK